MDQISFKNLNTGSKLSIEENYLNISRVSHRSEFQDAMSPYKQEIVESYSEMELGESESKEQAVNLLRLISHPKL